MIVPCIIATESANINTFHTTCTCDIGSCVFSEWLKWLPCHYEMGDLLTINYNVIGSVNPRIRYVAI